MEGDRILQSNAETDAAGGCPEEHSETETESVGQWTSAKIFWPAHHVDRAPGFIVGWSSSSLHLCVACIVQSASIEAVERAVLRATNECTEADIQSIGRPEILGKWLGSRGGQSDSVERERESRERQSQAAEERERESLSLLPEFPTAEISQSSRVKKEKKEETGGEDDDRDGEGNRAAAAGQEGPEGRGVWFVLAGSPDDPRPRPRSVFVDGRPLTLCKLQCQIIFYQQPDLHHFLFPQPTDLVALLHRATAPDLEDFEVESDLDEHEGGQGGGSREGREDDEAEDGYNSGGRSPKTPLAANPSFSPLGGANGRVGGVAFFGSSSSAASPSPALEKGRGGKKERELKTRKRQNESKKTSSKKGGTPGGRGGLNGSTETETAGEVLLLPSADAPACTGVSVTVSVSASPTKAQEGRGSAGTAAATVPASPVLLEPFPPSSSSAEEEGRGPFSSFAEVGTLCPSSFLAPAGAGAEGEEGQGQGQRQGVSGGGKREGGGEKDVPPKSVSGVFPAVSSSSSNISGRPLEEKEGKEKEEGEEPVRVCLKKDVLQDGSGKATPSSPAPSLSPVEGKECGLKIPSGEAEEVLQREKKHNLAVEEHRSDDQDGGGEVSQDTAAESSSQKEEPGGGGQEEQEHEEEGKGEVMGGTEKGFKGEDGGAGATTICKGAATQPTSSSSSSFTSFLTRLLTGKPRRCLTRRPVSPPSHFHGLVARDGGAHAHGHAPPGTQTSARIAVSPPPARSPQSRRHSQRRRSGSSVSAATARGGFSEDMSPGGATVTVPGVASRAPSVSAADRERERDRHHGGTHSTSLPTLPISPVRTPIVRRGDRSGIIPPISEACQQQQPPRRADQRLLHGHGVSRLDRILRQINLSSIVECSMRQHLEITAAMQSASSQLVDRGPGGFGGPSAASSASVGSGSGSEILQTLVGTSSPTGGLLESPAGGVLNRPSLSGPASVRERGRRVQNRGKGKGKQGHPSGADSATPSSSQGSPPLHPRVSSSSSSSSENRKSALRALLSSLPMPPVPFGSSQACGSGGVSMSLNGVSSSPPGDGKMMAKQQAEVSVPPLSAEDGENFPRWGSFHRALSFSFSLVSRWMAGERGASLKGAEESQTPQHTQSNGEGKGQNVSLGGDPPAASQKSSRRGSSCGRDQQKTTEGTPPLVPLAPCMYPQHRLTPAAKGGKAPCSSSPPSNQPTSSQRRRHRCPPQTLPPPPPGTSSSSGSNRAVARSAKTQAGGSDSCWEVDPDLDALVAASCGDGLGGGIKRPFRRPAARDRTSSDLLPCRRPMMHRERDERKGGVDTPQLPPLHTSSTEVLGVDLPPRARSVARPDGRLIWSRSAATATATAAGRVDRHNSGGSPSCPPLFPFAPVPPMHSSSNKRGGDLLPPHHRQLIGMPHTVMQSPPVSREPLVHHFSTPLMSSRASAASSRFVHRGSTAPCTGLPLAAASLPLPLGSRDYEKERGAASSHLGGRGTGGEFCFSSTPQPRAVPRIGSGGGGFTPLTSQGTYRDSRDRERVWNRTSTVSSSTLLFPHAAPLSYARHSPLPAASSDPLILIQHGRPVGGMGGTRGGGSVWGAAGHHGGVERGLLGGGKGIKQHGGGGRASRAAGEGGITAGSAANHFTCLPPGSSPLEIFASKATAAAAAAAAAGGPLLDTAASSQMHPRPSHIGVGGVQGNRSRERWQENLRKPSEVCANLLFWSALTFLRVMSAAWRALTYGEGLKRLKRAVIRRLIKAAFVWCAFVSLFSSLVQTVMIEAGRLVGSGRGRGKAGTWVGDRELFAMWSHVLLRVRVQSQWPALYYRVLRYRSRDRTLYLSNKLLLLSSTSVVLFDTLAGGAVCLFLFSQTKVVLNMVHLGYEFLHLDMLRSRVDWLMASPVGFKLNSNVCHFLSSCILTMAALWNGMTTFATPFEPLIVLLIASCSILGLSAQLALTSDVLNFCTLHVFYIYACLAWLFRVVTSSLYSLWNLFRGLKWNVLRKRVDSCAFDLEQVLVGVILFSLFTFLFPTLAVFYIVFLAIWLVVVLTHCLLRLLLAICSNFPLYLLLLHFSDPNIFSGGVTLNIGSADRGGEVEGEDDLQDGSVPLCRSSTGAVHTRPRDSGGAARLFEFEGDAQVETGGEQPRREKTQIMSAFTPSPRVAPLVSSQTAEEEEEERRKRAGGPQKPSPHRSPPDISGESPSALECSAFFQNAAASLMREVRMDGVIDHINDSTHMMQQEELGEEGEEGGEGEAADQQLGPNTPLVQEREKEKGSAAVSVPLVTAASIGGGQIEHNGKEEGEGPPPAAFGSSETAAVHSPGSKKDKEVAASVKEERREFDDRPPALSERIPTAEFKSPPLETAQPPVSSLSFSPSSPSPPSGSRNPRLLPVSRIGSSSSRPTDEHWKEKKDTACEGRDEDLSSEISENEFLEAIEEEPPPPPPPSTAAPGRLSRGGPGSVLSSAPPAANRSQSVNADSASHADRNRKECAATSFLLISARPLALGVKLSPFFRGLRATFQHLSPLRLLKSVLVGEIIHPCLPVSGSALEPSSLNASSGSSSSKISAAGGGENSRRGRWGQRRGPAGTPCASPSSARGDGGVGSSSSRRLGRLGGHFSGGEGFVGSGVRSDSAGTTASPLRRRNWNVQPSRVHGGTGRAGGAAAAGGIGRGGTKFGSDEDEGGDTATATASSGQRGLDSSAGCKGRGRASNSSAESRGLPGRMQQSGLTSSQIGGAGGGGAPTGGVGVSSGGEWLWAQCPFLIAEFPVFSTKHLWELLVAIWKSDADQLWPL
uniref:Uncharacterized protein n=1 Tax=Chromera velia CCMP2878 TaxID=1169474 RepID=A0A0G4F029_9ALVE|eukprot:Cvel_14337.t1-p1 / transcript=Cvel_14337.t1 / gene=Cvel_14337 / organism=Chromera_velia_CCMP2878 / gene_product=N-acetylglucosaminyl-phosphatidylinositol, putative / transcript_product=N-acetylglucosaminyl-phosphatidylinositol, putative / location=Cvel_scaffold1015:34377-52073(+) / protein_length=2768 / sequence_SO=supercontig / SO=protein_coding / is_pseudo=false